jgi:hypothetical protein
MHCNNMLFSALTISALMRCSSSVAASVNPTWCHARTGCTFCNRRCFAYKRVLYWFGNKRLDHRLYKLCLKPFCAGGLEATMLGIKIQEHMHCFVASWKKRVLWAHVSQETRRGELDGIQIGPILQKHRDANLYIEIRKLYKGNPDHN